MPISPKLKKICNEAIKASEYGYINQDSLWFPKRILPKFDSEFLPISSILFDKKLNEIGISKIKEFAHGLDSRCYLAKDKDDKPYNICVRLVDLRDEPMPRSSIDFNLKAHITFSNDQHRMEVLPLIFVPAGPKKIGGMHLARFLDELSASTHDFSATRLGIADMGVLPDGTILNVDAGNCPMPALVSDQDVQKQFEIDCCAFKNLPDPLIWRTQEGMLKQNKFFPNPF